MQYGEGYDRKAQIAPGAQSPGFGVEERGTEVGGQENSPEGVIQVESSRMSESYRDSVSFCIRRLIHTLGQGRAEKRDGVVGRS